MLRKWKPILILAGSLGISIWWIFGPFNMSDEHIYPHAQYADDISRVYYDLGRFCEERQDREGAIAAYQTALSYRPELVSAQERLLFLKP